MEKQQAKNLIKETFENSFDKGRFTRFSKNLLNHIEEAPFTYQGQYIPEAYRQYISTLERIGKFNDGENRIDILIIKLQKETSLERARTMQRNFAAWYLNGSRGGELKDAALVAFLSPDEEDWRFSLVRMDYKFEQTKTGRMKVKEEFTPAWRWSFLVGANEKSHTAQSRLVNILANDEQAPTLAELEKSFDIETVTKEFFIKYRELFIRTKEALDSLARNDAKISTNFKANGVNTVDFAKKLLGQIIFLYFLQKKGWFGVGRDAEWGTGSKHFLRELFEKKHAGYKNFFNDILEPLFYEALRVGEERKQDDYYYSRFNCKIPFLNGGLFDPIGNYDWVHTDINIPDSLFSNAVKTKEGDTGDGILDVFDRYNFTVKEDEPLEKEVAIDPELLGKAYEKFNAIRPDNFEEYKKALKTGKAGEESKFNKQYGVYYTPREIVHYMCQQSLINYLFAELNSCNISYEKLGDSNLNIFANEGDKGQLALTIEHRENPEILKEDIETLIHCGEQVRENESIAIIKEQKINEGKQKTSDYKLKLPESIRKNAQLIDEKLADITICDPAVGSGAFPVGMMSEIVKARNVLSTFILDEKRTIYDFKRQCIEHSLYGVDIDPGAVEIAKLRLWLSLMVDEDDIKNIKPLPNLDYKIVCGNSLIGVEKNLFNAQLFSELEKLKPLYFNETNPTKKQDYKKQIDGLISQITNGHKEFDFEVYFSEVFHSGGGFDVVIGNPPYITIGGKEDMNVTQREKEYYLANYICTDYKPNYFVFFFERGWRLIKRSAFLIYIVPRTFVDNLYFGNIRTFLQKNARIRLVIKINSEVFGSGTTGGNAICGVSKNAPTGAVRVAVIDSVIEISNPTWRIIDQEKVLFGENNAFVFETAEAMSLFWKIKSKGKQLETYCSVNNGVNTGNAAKFLLADKPKGKKYRKLLEGKDVHRYSIIWGGNWINYDPNLKEQIKIQELDTRQTRIDFALRDPWIFDSPKIIIRQTSDKLIGCLDEDKYVTRHSTHCIVAKHGGVSLKYILTILNSKLMNFYYQTLVSEIGKAFAEVKAIYVKQFPICPASNNQQSQIELLVDRILASKRGDAGADTKDCEREIDQLVYQLYGLTPEEIKIVEGKDENTH